jgi:predicted RNA-binding Zn ribbon-like protein
MSGMIDSAMPEAPLLADHLALDLLNTTARSDDAVVDYWNSGDDVLTWLARCGVKPVAPGQVDRSALLAQAVRLRALARRLIARQKEGEASDVKELNTFLHAYLSAPHLGVDEDGKLTLSRKPGGDAIGALLGPVAEAVGKLLVAGDFALVRQCEHPDCILWFYDRTKAHKRRWCSMAVCGNRYKAAQFRMKNSRATV